MVWYKNLGIDHTLQTIHCEKKKSFQTVFLFIIIITIIIIII